VGGFLHRHVSAMDMGAVKAPTIRMQAITTHRSAMRSRQPGNRIRTSR
jgi:hypothetical protein